MAPVVTTAKQRHHATAAHAGACFLQHDGIGVIYTHDMCLIILWRLPIGIELISAFFCAQAGYSQQVTAGGDAQPVAEHKHQENL